MRTGDRPAVALDANVILRFLIQDGGDLAEKASRVMGQVEDGEVIAHLDPVILAEVVWVLTSYYGQKPARVGEALLPLVKAEGIAIEGKERYARALELFAAGGLHFGDACACALAEARCGGRLISFDRKLTGVASVTRSEGVGAGD